MLPAILLPLWLYNVAPLKRAMRWVADKVMRIPPMARFILNLWGIVVILGKPLSRGHLRLRSADPREPAEIDPAYFSDPRDLDAMLAGVRIGRRIASAPALAAWGNRELGPGKRKTSDLGDHQVDSQRRDDHIPLRRHLPHGHGCTRAGRHRAARARSHGLARR